MCAEANCRGSANDAFTFCYPCHQKGKAQGYLIDKSGKRITIKESNNPNLPKSKTKRAFEAMCEGFTEAQMEEMMRPASLEANATTMSQENEGFMKRLRGAFNDQ